MCWLWQSLVLVLIGLASAGVIYTTVGSPDRSVACEQADLDEWEVCWNTVQEDWGGNVLWIDARSQEEYAQGHVEGALLVPERDAENYLSKNEVMQEIGTSGVEGRRIVVYCASEACGGSKVVAEKIRATGFHSEVYMLFGGWKAVDIPR